MKDDDFDQMFGRKPTETRPSFVERVKRSEAFGGRSEPPEAQSFDRETIGPTPDEYRAFGMMPSSQVHAFCELRWWMEGTTVRESLAFPYRLLMGVGCTGEDTLRILLPDKVIEIAGAHLEPLHEGLMRQRVTFVQQWTRQVWRGKPTDGSFVERIAVVR
ncbi:hypothetical protein [Brevundimonas sp.]|jgi:hypothetical protein|uniref:hypothetical protein n=1 Tax=Brevundimonas sp. TaxID=1871086 RepID=UPI003919C712